MLSQDTRTWHVLQLSNVLDEEFASALSESVNVIGWRPEWRLLGSTSSSPAKLKQPRRSASMHVRNFPIMRGYARPLLSWLARIGPRLCHMLLSHARSVDDVLVCTTPFLAPVVERWPGPVVYWLTDRIASYQGARGINVPALDRRICRAATLVCPNSARLQQYLMEEAGCDEERIMVLPNATRAANLLSSPLLQAEPLPEAVSHRESPVAGVLGNMGGNLDWKLLLRTVRATPWLTWLFVGPVNNDVLDAEQRKARQEVQYCHNACFTGGKPYGELVQYARSLDVAVLPYLRCEPTFSGSSTRFYEHLAACRPMLATHGFEELLHKEPLLRLVRDADEMIAALNAMRENGFRDGYETLRWRESLSNTWQARSASMQAALASRLHTAYDLPTLHAA